MNNKYLLLLIVVIAVAACNQAPALKTSEGDVKGAPGKNDTLLSDSIGTQDNKGAVSPADNIIYEELSSRALPVLKLKKSIVSNNQSIHIKINDLGPGMLHVTVEHSLSNGNIRLSQIILPDGNTDGPFGREASYEIKEKGNYTLIFDKSNMASGSPVGDVFISIEK